MQRESNYRSLRDAFKHRSPPLIPYLGMYLTDLVFTEDGNKDNSADGLINFTKRRLVAKTIRDIQTFQLDSYALIPLPQLQVSHQAK